MPGQRAEGQEDSTSVEEELFSEVFLPDARGRQANRPPAIAVVRPLASADVPTLQSKRVATEPLKLKQIRHAHHQLARLMATGQDQAEIALITGYSPAYISTIKNDPQFADLMATYAGQRQLAFVDVLERMKSLGLSCMEELQERLADEPHKWANRELMELAELLLVKPQKVALPVQQSTGPSVAINVKFVSSGSPAMAEAVVVDGPPARERITVLNQRGA